MNKSTAVLFALFFSLFSAHTVFAQEANLGDVNVRFCNDAAIKEGTRSLNLQTKTSVPTDICMYLSNNSDKPITMLINFVDGTVTADSDQKKACQPEGVQQQFGQYVSLEKKEYLLQPKQTIQVNATATFPDGYAGMNYGCVTTQIVWDKPANPDGNMFTIQTRKANFIDVLVDGSIELGVEVVPQTAGDVYTSLSDNPNVFIYQDIATQTWMAKVIYKNIGNVSQEVVVDGTVAGYFSTKALESQTRKILPKQEAAFLFTLDNATIPRYRGPIQVAFKATYTPQFDFALPSITADMKTAKTLMEQASFMLMPRVLIGICGGLIVLLLLLSLKKRHTHKKHSAPKKAPAKKAAPKAAPKKTTTKTATTKAAPKKTTTTKTTTTRKKAA